MKFHNIKNMAGAGALTLLAALSAASCTDKNDWDVDSSYDRIFHTTSLAVTPLDDRAAVEFKTMPNTAKYVVEVSKDTLYDEVAENANGTSIIKELTTTPDTIYNLEGSTKYFIRMRGVSEDGVSSKWKYLDKYSFKTKAEQIITNVVAGSTTAKVYFTAGKTVDAAYVYKDGDSTRVAISAAEVEAGLIELTGLKDNSTYRVKLWNGDIVRGSISFKTTEAYPDGYEVLTLAAGENLHDLLASATSDKVVVVFPQGMEYEQTSAETGERTAVKIPENIKSIYFWGAAGESQPTFYPKGVDLEGSELDIIRFYNLHLLNNGTSGDYVLNITGAPVINSIQIEKCTVEQTRGVVRFQSITGGSVGEVSIKNCVIGHIGSYGIFNSKSQTKMTIGSLNISETTIYDVNTNSMINIHQEGAKVNIESCTLYKAYQASKSIVDVNKTTITPKFSNVLIGTYYPLDENTTVKPCSVKGQQEDSNVFYTSDMGWNSGYEMGSQINGSSTDLWNDPENGDFTIKSLFKSDYENYGDPRWKENE